MHIAYPCFLRLSLRLCRCILMCLFAAIGGLATCSVAFAQEAQQSREPGAQIRLPRQQAQTNAALDGVVRSGGAAGAQVPVAGATLTLQNLASNLTAEYLTNAEGVFRIFPLAPGDYALRVQADSYEDLVLAKI